ncbi:MAG: segregation/condensation protein A [archaeon]|nr:MAG: segregation/condensation protein A [archaeon]
MEKEVKEKVTQDQLYNLLVSRELSWQAIISDLIKTEQLHPWDIDISILANKFLEKIMQLQELEENTFFISSKVLLAAAILLRMKSEILRENIRSIDEVLFEDKGKVGISKIPQIMIPGEEESKVLVPRTPLPRARKVTLNELMTALEKAINTEHRRIKKRLSIHRARRELDFAFPRPILNVPKKIRELWGRLRDIFYKEKRDKVMFSQLLSTETKEEKLATFVPLMFLDHQRKIWVEQEEPFADIEVWLKKRPELLSESDNK